MTAELEPAAGLQTDAVAQDPKGQDSIGRVLVVDLDGTLSRTDTLHEAILGLVARNPASLFHLPKWMSEGRAGLKAHVADALIIPGDQLPLNDTVLAEIRAAKAAGRRVALVSAADQRQVAAVAETVGLFDEVHGSAAGTNLKGTEKAAFLTERYGAKGFDYIGDSKADLPVWAAAHQALTVRADAALQAAAEAVNGNVRHLDPPQKQAATLSMLRAMRPHQWSKNTLLFVPAVAAHDSWSFWIVLWGFIAFCMTASAVYLINDLLDLPSDRAHPRKRKRPFAAGELSAVSGLVTAAALLLTAFIVALLTGSLAFLGTLGLYLLATFAYSLWLKRKLLIDVLMLAGLYTVRIIAGGAVAGLVLSPWLLGFSMFIFLALAAVKRQAELTDQLKTGRESSGRAYQVDDLPVLRGLGMSSGTAAILVLALYISSAEVQPHYNHPWVLWLMCPLILYWMLRMVMETHRGNMTDDPIVFAATDRTSQVVVVLCGVIALLAKY